MRELTALTLASAVAVIQMSPLAAQNASTGIVSGTVNGTDGPLAAVTVQALDASGTIVGSAVTTETGAFSIPGLSAGTFAVQVVGANGVVIGATTVTLAEGAMIAAVTVNATAGAVAAAATAATGTVASTTAGAAISSTAVLAAVGAAVAVGTAAVIATNEDVSGSR